MIATGICGSDFHGYSGENGRRHPGQVMGHETVGRIGELGSDVTGLAAGPAGHRQPGHGLRRLCGLRERSAAVVQPQGGARGGAGDLGGVCRPGCRTGREHRDSAGGDAGRAGGPGGADGGRLPRRTPRRGNVAGDRVLVIGGGPIGQACLLAARRLGVDNLAISDVSPSRRELCAGLGAQVIDPTAGDLAEAVTAPLGGPATLVVDAVGRQPDRRRRVGRLGPRAAGSCWSAWARRNWTWRRTRSARRSGA